MGRGWGIGGGTAVTAGSVYRVTQGYPSVLSPLTQNLSPFMMPTLAGKFESNKTKYPPPHDATINAEI